MHSGYLAFKNMISKCGGKQDLILHCTYLYFIFVKVFNVDLKIDLFIQTPTFSFNEVKLILERGFLTQSIFLNSSQSNTTLCNDRYVNFLTSCEFIIFCFNIYNFKKYFYSLQDIVLQCSIVSCVF